MAGLDRLVNQLNTTGLQQKDNPLYQVIKQLIQALKELDALVAASGAGGSTVNNITQITQFLSSGDDSGGGDGSEVLMIDSGGDDGTGGMVPYFIALNEIFTVPEFKQALFQMTIDVEGILAVDGYLIQVD